MATGATLAFFWEFVGLVEITGLPPMLAGVVGSTTVMITVSLATQRTSPVPEHVTAAMDEAARVRPIPPALLAKFD